MINGDELQILHKIEIPKDMAVGIDEMTPQINGPDQIKAITENSIETSDIPWIESTNSTKEAIKDFENF